jgi:hypothetical protein
MHILQILGCKKTASTPGEREAKHNTKKTYCTSGNIAKQVANIFHDRFMGMLYCLKPLSFRQSSAPIGNKN